ncbi:MAG: flagellar export chaperone FliS, partial [Desulfuromusa sp.]
YRNNQVMTASPEQILIMLYDGAIRFVRQAKFAIEDGRKADKAIAIGKAIAIITEFSNTLDYEVGGEIALDLSQLYDFMIRELSAVNARSDIDRLGPVETVLLDLREGFAGAVENNQQGSRIAANAKPAVKQVAASF